MAVTVDTTRRGFGATFEKGMRLSTFTIKIGAPSDYGVTPGAEGIDMTQTFAQLGLGSLADVLAAVWKKADDTINPFVTVFNSKNNRLRAFKGSAGALVEVAPADLVAGDQIVTTIFGG
jgi:hypothetical protein